MEKNNMNKQIAIFIVSIIIVGGGSFFGGMQFQKSQKTSNSSFGNFQRQGGGIGTGMTRRNNGGGFSNGTILSMDDKSITLKLRNGGSQIIFFGDSTSILKSDTGAKSDLAVDQNITVTGKTNSDGSVTANSIQIMPIRPINNTVSNQPLIPANN